MTGISDQFTTIGVESSWGTVASTLTRGIEVIPAKPTLDLTHRHSEGLRPGRLGMSANPVVDIRGGTYPLATDLWSLSHSMLLAAAGSDPVITTPDGATNARLHTITPSDATLRSHSILDAPSLSDNSIDYVSFLGAIATGLTITQAAQANARLGIDFNFKTMNTAASSVSPVYGSSPYIYRDTDLTTTIGGSDICQRSVDFTIPTGAKTDLNRICPGGRNEPRVAAAIEPTGNLSVDLASVSYLNNWMNGTTFSLVFEYEGPEIESGFNYFTRFTFAACLWTGDVYERSLTDLTSQPLPWKAVDNLSDPVWKIEYQTTDTAA